MGHKTDGYLLKAAAEARHNAFSSVDAKGATAAGYEAVHEANGRIDASVPKPAFMAVYPSMASAVNDTVPTNKSPRMSPLDASMKPLPVTTAPRVMTVLDKIFMMDCQTDGHLLQAAAETHQNAFSSVEAKRVTSAAPHLHPHSLSRVGPKSDTQPSERARCVGPSFYFYKKAQTEVRVLAGSSKVNGVKS